MIYKVHLQYVTCLKFRVSNLDILVAQTLRGKGLCAKKRSDLFELLSLPEEESALLRRKIAQTAISPPPSLIGRTVSPLIPFMEVYRNNLKS